MTKKTAKAYCAIWKHLEENFPELVPRIVISDFEKAMIKSMKLSFPTTKVSGCLFHFCQVSTISKNEFLT